MCDARREAQTLWELPVVAVEAILACPGPGQCVPSRGERAAIVDGFYGMCAVSHSQHRPQVVLCAAFGFRLMSSGCVPPGSANLDPTVLCLAAARVQVAVCGARVGCVRGGMLSALWARTASFLGRRRVRVDRREAQLSAVAARSS